MKFIETKFLLFVFFIVFILMGINKCYAKEYIPNIISDDNLGELYKVYNYKNQEYILVSGNSNFTKISKLDISTNNIETLKELKINCEYAYLKNNKLYILLSSDQESDSSIGNPTINTIVYIYDLEGEAMLSPVALMCKIDAQEKFCIDDNGRMYYVYNNSIKCISYEGGNEKTISIQNPISSIEFNSYKGLVYILSSYYSRVAYYDVNNDTIVYDTVDECPNGKILFLNNQKVVDALNNVYEISSNGISFIKKFEIIPRGKFYNACEIDNKILSYNGTDRFYIFDNSTYNLLGQIYINNNILCIQAGDNLLSICKNGERYIYYIVDVNTYEKVDDIIIIYPNNLFDFQPQSGIYNNIVIDENYFWKLILKDGLIIDNYKELKVNILDTNSGKNEELTINNGLSVDKNSVKIFPSNICYNNLFYYKLTISGICTNIGEPCVIKHSLDVYYKTPNSAEYYISSDVYNIDYKNKLITGVEPSTTVAAFKKNFNVKGYNMLILDNAGNLKPSGNISTGKSISFIKDGKTEYKFKIIIYGDINGSGNITSRDLYVLRNYLLGKSEISDEFLMAADINHDNKVDTLDLLCLSEYLMGEYNIIQRYDRGEH